MAFGAASEAAGAARRACQGQSACLLPKESGISVPQAERLYHKRFAALTMVLKQYPYCICTASCMAGKEARKGGNRIGKKGLSQLVHR